MKKQVTDTVAWQKARELSKRVQYAADMGMMMETTKQALYKASMEITSGISEGYEQDSDEEFLKHMKLSQSSTKALSEALQIAFKNERISALDYKDLVQEAAAVSTLIKGMIKKVSKRKAKENN